MCLSSPDRPVPGLPKLCSAGHGEGQPGAGALRHDVQRGVPVGAADDTQPTHCPAESPGLHQVHPCGPGRPTTPVRTPPTPTLPPPTPTLPPPTPPLSGVCDHPGKPTPPTTLSCG